MGAALRLLLAFDFPFPPPLPLTLPLGADADTVPEILLLPLEITDFFFPTRPEATVPPPETGVAVALTALPFPFPAGAFDCLLVATDTVARPDPVVASPVGNDLRDVFFAAAAATVVVFGCFTVVLASAVDVRRPGAYPLTTSHQSAISFSPSLLSTQFQDSLI